MKLGCSPVTGSCRQVLLLSVVARLCRFMLVVKQVVIMVNVSVLDIALLT